uniref:Secreted protein n=1 Tax=Salarias fasciatus TaxID=181472 RepID=A0A672J9A0_SALFA
MVLPVHLCFFLSVLQFPAPVQKHLNRRDKTLFGKETIFVHVYQSGNGETRCALNAIRSVQEKQSSSGEYTIRNVGGAPASVTGTK